MASFIDKVPHANCTISYSVGGDYHSMQMKVKGIGKGFTPIFTESHARAHRALYPMQKALTPFFIQLDCNGYKEFKQCMGFFVNYLHNSAGNPTSALEAAMTVMVFPFKNAKNSFIQQGVPISGISDGDHVGSMVFDPTISFESYLDPSDTSMWNSSGGFQGASYEVFGTSSQDDAAKFFYPRSPGSVDPKAKGESLYDTPIPPPPKQPSPPAYVAPSQTNIQGPASPAGLPVLGPSTGRAGTY